MGARNEGNPPKLEKYWQKRSASGTTEPFGGAAVPGSSLFVVQKHAATLLHWDLRLELDGVLLSWAVPRGPSPNQADKRLAIHVEDHPVEYANYEGVIPKGQYGAGPIIIWDKGTWTPIEDPKEGLEKGKLLFELRGYKLRGKWTLVKTKGGDDNHWLLIKEFDAHEDPEGGTEGYPDDSIFSGLTVEELRAGGDQGTTIRERLTELECRESLLVPKAIDLMLAEAREEPFNDANWVFEIKYDGYRMLAGLAGEETALISRNGNDLTETFPDVERAIRGLPYKNLVLDGEIVVHDAAGLPSFQLMQKRGRLTRRSDVLRAAQALPATFYAFDLLGFEGFDLRGLPLLDRKKLLKEVLPNVGPVRFSDHIPDQGEAMYRHIASMGLEGVVAKRADAPYFGGRSASWLKIRTVNTADFVICGTTKPKGGGSGFGALHVAQYDGNELVYCGRVGTGFSNQVMTEIHEDLLALADADPPEGKTVPRGPKHRWVAPELVVEIKYKELTEAGHLRHPSFQRIRDDKSPEECQLSGHGRVLEEPRPIIDQSIERVVHLSNLDKIFWEKEGYTKGDLVDYYRVISPWILPHLADRPIVLTRFPDGPFGKSFFQKNAPEFAPEWIRRVQLYSEGSEKDLGYFVADDLETLLYIANSASIPLHVWQSRVAHLARPDYCVLDLDPKEAPFSDVVRIALLLKEVCDAIELPSFVKTSGSSGIHVLLPLGRQFTYEQSRTLGELLANVVVRDLPEIATVARRPSQREGKVYIDYLQNGHGRLIVAPYCVRPLPGATVSAPLDWGEVNNRLSIGKFTIRSMPRRMARRKQDPLDGLMSLVPDLLGSLQRLQTHVL